MPQDVDTRYKHMSLSDLAYDFGVAGQLTALSEKHPRLLVIIETINSLYLLPWIHSLPKEVNVTILQLNAGIASHMSKSKPDMTDIALLYGMIAVKEVYDMESLMSLLLTPGKQYIRVPNGDTHSSIFPKPIEIHGGVGDIRDRGFEGVAGTVIAPGGVLVQTIHALQHLDNEGKSYDLFVLSDYDFTIGKELKESIIKTENIIFLLDQNRRTIYESVVKAKLRDSGLVDTETHFVYPNADKINTILPEYLWEQANWDGLGIAEKINSIH